MNAVNTPLEASPSLALLDPELARRMQEAVATGLDALEKEVESLRRRLDEAESRRAPLLAMRDALAELLGGSPGEAGSADAGRDGTGPQTAPDDAGEELADYVRVAEDGSLKPKTGEIVLTTVAARGPLARLELVAAVLDRFGEGLARLYKDPEDAVSIAARRLLKRGELAKDADDRFFVPTGRDPGTTDGAGR